jgi:hypothetical protein
MRACTTGSDTVMAAEPAIATTGPVERAVWDTIWLVAQLPGMTESYERLLEYGEIVSHGLPTRSAALLLLEILGRSEPRQDEWAEEQGGGATSEAHPGVLRSGPRLRFARRGGRHMSPHRDQR